MSNNTENLEIALEHARAAVKAARAQTARVWEALGGREANEATWRAARLLPKGDFYEGTYGLPRWKVEKIAAERRQAAEGPRRAYESAKEAEAAIKRHPDYVQALAAERAANDAASAALAALREAASASEKEEAAKKAAEELASFRWGGKDADGDWAD